MSLATTLGDVDTQQDEGYTKQGHEADGLVQKEHRTYQGEERIEVEVIGRLDGTQPAKHHVPSIEAEQRSKQT